MRASQNGLHRPHLRYRQVAKKEWQHQVNNLERVDPHSWPQAQVIGNPQVHPTGVTTVILSFNGARYLRAAVDSALSQELERYHQIWIHDDASVDESPEIVRNLVSEYPDKLVGILQRNNQFSQDIRIRDLVARGIPTGHVAFLDGDDYWTEPAKLSMQCHLLDSEPFMSLVTHHCRFISDDGTPIRIQRVPGRYKRRIGVSSFAMSNPIMSPTVVFRAAAFHRLKKPTYRPSRFQDWELWARLSTTGCVGTVDRVMADYRQYASQTEVTLGPESTDDASQLRRALIASTIGLDRRRFQLALVAGELSGSLRTISPRTAKLVETFTRTIIEASAANLRLRPNR